MAFKGTPNYAFEVVCGRGTSGEGTLKVKGGEGTFDLQRSKVGEGVPLTFKVKGGEVPLTFKGQGWRYFDLQRSEVGGTFDLQRSKVWGGTFRLRVVGFRFRVFRLGF